MALLAGLPMLDFSIISGEKKLNYFIAIQSGLDCNCLPMETFFSEIIANSVRF